MKKWLGLYAIVAVGFALLSKQVKTMADSTATELQSIDDKITETGAGVKALRDQIATLQANASNAGSLSPGDQALLDKTLADANALAAPFETPVVTPPTDPGTSPDASVPSTDSSAS